MDVVQLAVVVLFFSLCAVGAGLAWRRDRRRMAQRVAQRVKRVQAPTLTQEALEKALEQAMQARKQLEAQHVERAVVRESRRYAHLTPPASRPATSSQHRPVISPPPESWTGAAMTTLNPAPEFSRGGGFGGGGASGSWSAPDCISAPDTGSSCSPSSTD